MASGTINGTTNNKYITAKIEWTSTADYTNNKSSLTAQLYYKKSSSSTEATSGTIKATINVNGMVKDINLSGKKLPPDNKWYYIAETTVTLTHLSDGSKSVTISATGGFSGTSFTTTNLSGTATLDKIPRKATCTGATDFTDADNPVIYYSNPAGTAVTALEACISLTGDKSDIPYRAISKTGTSYTFKLTDAELKTLTDNTSGNSRTVKFFIRTTIGTTQYLSYVTRTFSLSDTTINFNPVTIYDSNSKTTALTGNNQVMIAGYSNAFFNVTCVANSGAEITSQSITCGSQKSTNKSGTLYGVTSGEFLLSATDTKGNTSSVYVDKDLIQYFKPNYNIDIKPPTTSGVMEIEVTGTFFNSSFGKVNNTLEIQYIVEHEGSGFSQGGYLTLEIDKNNYSGSVTISDLDYRKGYLVTIVLYDKLEERRSEAIRATGTPIFDWGANDFQFNVPVKLLEGYSGKEVGIYDDLNDYTQAGHYYINNVTDVKHRPTKDTGHTAGLIVNETGAQGQREQIYFTSEKMDGKEYRRHYNAGSWGNWQLVRYNRGFRVLYEETVNKWFMHDAVITLEDESSLSFQPNGYIIVWSLQGLTNTNWNYTYLPKAHTYFSSSNGTTFTSVVALANATFACKSVVVKETASAVTDTTTGEIKTKLVTTITGTSDNEPNNSSWLCIRYVLGY